MTWTCELTEARLSDYLDGLLEPAERQAFDAHVSGCERCAPLVASVSELVGDLHSLEAIEPAPRLVYAILNSTLGPRDAKQTLRSSFGWLRGLVSMRLAYGLVSVAATFLVLLTATGFSWRKPKLSELAPANLYRQADSKVHVMYARSMKFVTDLRVVYEIQSLRSKDSDLPTEQEGTLPKTSPGKNPGSTDRTKPATPRQQNRANGLGRELEILAAEVPAISTEWCGHLLPRRIP